MDNTSTGLLLTAFLALLIGIVLIGVVATQTSDTTTTTIVTNETLDTSSARVVSASPPAFMLNISGRLDLANKYASGDWQTGDSDCDFTILSVTNSTSNLASSDYNVTNDGVLTFTRTDIDADGINSSQVGYRYCEDDYLSESWTRTVLDLVPGFFGITLLLISVGLFYSIAKRERILS